jgi:hypothetical protein
MWLSRFEAGTMKNGIIGNLPGLGSLDWEVTENPTFPALNAESIGELVC